MFIPSNRKGCLNKSGQRHKQHQGVRHQGIKDLPWPQSKALTTSTLSASLPQDPVRRTHIPSDEALGAFGQVHVLARFGMLHPGPGGFVRLIAQETHTPPRAAAPSSPRPTASLRSGLAGGRSIPSWLILGGAQSALSSEALGRLFALCSHGAWHNRKLSGRCRCPDALP